MSTATIHSGVCGFTTTVEARLHEADQMRCHLTINSDCPAIQKLGQALTEVNAFKEISFKRAVPQTYQTAFQHCAHAACPVPSGIIKAVEVEAGLALPADVHIQVRRGPAD